MGDEIQEEPSKPRDPPTLTGKAGWLKKSSGKFLGTYKDRYIHIDKTEIVVYENEDLQHCVERLDLENFEKCHELRSPFKKKYRLVLLRSPKSGNKVGDVKLQAQTPEEKEAWIKALSDAINRAKNKIFDEVKVDESISLEHVTRSRPKGNRGRRPPTRIHMKEAANTTSDGILRLDLDAFENTPNGTPFPSANSGPEDAAKSASKSLEDISEEVPAEEAAPQKKVLKPPMPPSKSNKPNEGPESISKPEESTPPKKVVPVPPSKDQKPVEIPQDKKEVEEKKTIKPPMPPSKDKKPRISSVGDVTDDSSKEREASEGENTAQEDVDSKKPVASSLTEHSTSPTSKDQVATVSDKDSESDEDKKDMDVLGNLEETRVPPLLNNVPKPQCVMWDSPSSAVEKSEENSNASQSLQTNVIADFSLPAWDIKASSEVGKKGFARPAPPKKKPGKSSIQVSLEEQPVESASAEETNPDPKEEDKIITLCLSSSVSNQEVALESDKKSIDSGQISAEESENGDQVTPNTDKLQSSLEVLDGVTSEEELETCDGTQEHLSGTEKGPAQDSSQPSSQKSSQKRFASMEDISEFQKNSEASTVTDLQSKVSMELVETGGLLGKIAPKGDSEQEHDPEVLLATAMEKLRKAEQFLKEAKRFKENKSKRMSW